jgi:hypothetical protein
MAFEASSVPLSLTIQAGIAAQFCGPIEFTGNRQAGEQGVHYQAQAFPREVIDQRQDERGGRKRALGTRAPMTNPAGSQSALVARIFRRQMRGAITA